jgi:hypothetical protein
MSQAYWFNNNKIQASIQNKHISTKNKCKKERKKERNGKEGPLINSKDLRLGYSRLKAKS